MIYGVGTDLCDVRRIADTLDRRGDRFAHKLLGPAELAVFMRRRGEVAARGVRFLASRFAAKEAFSKAIGLGIAAPMAWHACEVLNQPDGRPRVQLHGDLAVWFAARALRAHVSLSDEIDYVAAFVVVETLSSP